MPRRGRPAHDDLLTPAEWRVVEGVRHGLSNPAIARRLDISADAVKFHVGNALQKLGFDSRHQLRLWTGLRKDSPLAHPTRSLPAMTHTTPIGPLGQIARTVADLGIAERWYRDVLGIRHLFTSGSMAFFDCGGIRLMLSQGVSQGESLLYFQVDGLPAIYAEVIERGAKALSAPHRVHRHSDGSEEWMAFVEDPEGRPLGLMQRVAAQQGQL